MAKITIADQKIFAGVTGYTGVVGKFGSYKAGAAAYSIDPDIIQSLSAYDSGLAAALTNNAPPTIQDLNGLFYLISRQIAYCLQTGIPEWNAATEYHIGSFVSVSDASYTDIFISVINNNINHAVSDEASWMIYKSNRVRTVLGAAFEYNDYMLIVTGPSYFTALPLANAANKGRECIVLSKVAYPDVTYIGTYNGEGYIDNRTGYQAVVMHDTGRVCTFVSTGTKWITVNNLNFPHI